MPSDARAYMENALGRSLEKEWSDEIKLVNPDGGEDVLRGQVLWDSTTSDPATGEPITMDRPVATVRRSTLTREPKDGEKWAVWIPKSNTDDTPVLHMLERAIRHGSIGMYRLYLTLPEQEPAP